MQRNSWLHRTNIFIRSLFFTVFVAIYIFFYSFISVALFPFPLRYRFICIMAWTRSIIWLLQKLCYINYEVEGWENIPKDRNGIIMCKHQSTWETFFIPGHFYEPAIILKRELLWIPFFGWGLATIDPIAINRNAKRSAMDQIISKGKKCLDAKRWILVFPEGTRMAPGQIGKYHMGGARLATNTGYPILPIAHNAGRFWPKRGFLKKPGTVKVVIGPMIETKDRSSEDVLAETKSWIEETMRRIDSAGD
jgi:1-acyl-sn-glycerol-3-phosphate acyltransferase